MRTKLTISAVVIALLVLPALAKTLGNAGTRNSVASGAVTELAETPSKAASTAQTTASGTLPSRGMTMAQVEKSHGTPVVRKAPVGSPPISRWEYEDFVVYFEYRHVIHSVAKLNR